MTADIPENTIFEREPALGLSPAATRLFKLMLLQLATLYGLDRTFDTPTEIIDQLEGMRRSGFIQIVDVGDGYQIRVTPTGSTSAWLFRHR
jgi:hypothetical protein